MAVAGFLTLLRDMSVIADDIAKQSALMLKSGSSSVHTIAKMSAKASVDSMAIVADDVAVTTVSTMVDVRQEREVKIILAVARGSFKNKIILVILALILSTYAGFLLPILLAIGGAYLAFEGAETVLEAFHLVKHTDKELKEENPLAPLSPEQYEAERVKGAVRTDFVLSAEIIVLSLSQLTSLSLWMKACVLGFLSVIMTVGVYGAVLMLVRLDNWGGWLIDRPAENMRSRFLIRFGQSILSATPFLIKTIALVGTIAMLGVGGHLLMGGLGLTEIFHHWESLAPHGLQGLVSITLEMSLALSTGIAIFIFSHLPLVKKVMKKLH